MDVKNKNDQVKDGFLSALLRQAVFAAPSSVIITDYGQSDNPIIYVNPAFEQLTGYGSSDVIGKNCRFLQGPETDDDALQEIRDAVRQGQKCRVSLVNYHKDGTPFWNDLYIAPLRNTYGEITHFVGLQNDITEEKQAEKNIKRLQKFTQAALDALKGHIAVLDKAGKIIAVNASWRNFADANCLQTDAYGIGTNYIHVCKQSEDLGDPDAGPVVAGIARVLSKEQREFTLEYPCHAPDGKELRWFMVRVTCFDEDSEPRLVVSHTNITERKLAEIELKKAYAEMEDRVVLRTQQLQETNEALLAEIAERLKIEQALRESEARFKAQYRAIPIPTYTWQKKGDHFVFIDYNDPAEHLGDGQLTNLLGVTAETFYGETRPDIIADMQACFENQTAITREMDYGLVSGSKRVHNVKYAFVPPDLIMIHADDITDKKALEDRVRQSQKMEAVGLMASGVAHDFNNILMVINGYSKLITQRNDLEEPVAFMLSEIESAGQRATALVQQLLAFSRNQPFRPKVLNINNIITNIQKMLRRLLPENVKLTFEPETDLEKALVDSGQFEQVLMNLVVNAKDAMPKGGGIVLKTQNIMLSETDVARFVDVSPGSYVRLMVQDTGSGIDKETLAHVFEPFFTTKELGKGTGLGLSTVYGIVKRASGFIEVESQPGIGTTFYVYLPSVNHQPDVINSEHLDRDVRGGSESILLVENDLAIQNFLGRVLTQAGYEVLMVSHPDQALEHCQSRKEPLDLLLTDVDLPGMDGKALSESVLQMVPDIQVIYMSGHTDDGLAPYGLLKEGISLLRKPLNPNDVLRLLRDVLDDRR